MSVKLVPGDFDNVSEWPMKRQINLSLLSQGGSGDAKIDLKLEDMYSRRPISNAGFFIKGRRIISHAAFNTGNYLKDDAIDIRMELCGAVP